MRLKNILPVIIIVLALVLRIEKIGEHAIAGDEKISLFMSRYIPLQGANQKDVFHKINNPYFTPKEFWKDKNIDDLFVALSRSENGSSALYAFSLHYWGNIFGLSDESLRGFSVMFGVLLVILLYFFVKDVFQSENLAICTMALAAIEPLLIAWSQTVRTYSMTFFFCLLATFLFLKIVKNGKHKNAPIWLFLAYGIVAFACLMCHYSTFTIFLLHGLITLLFVRSLPTWIGLALSMCIPLVGMVWWLKFGGGQYSFKYIADSARVYNEVVATKPVLGYLAPTSFYSVWVQILPIISNHFLPTNGLFDLLSGNKNASIALSIPFISILVYRYIKNESVKKATIFGLFFLGFMLYSINKIYFTELSVAIIILFLLAKDTIKQQAATRELYLSMWILGTLPLLFLVMFAIQDHNTFRIMHKYVGYSMAFMLVLVALSLRKLWTLPNWVRFSISIILLFQLYSIGNTIQTIWNDTAPRYLLFSKPRERNPYIQLANKIKTVYMPSDTIVYPSDVNTEYKLSVEAPTYSILDAQLCNFYLPKDANYIQRVDSHEPDKVILKKANGSQEVLFDFKGKTYRY